MSNKLCMSGCSHLSTLSQVYKMCTFPGCVLIEIKLSADGNLFYLFGLFSTIAPPP